MRIKKCERREGMREKERGREREREKLVSNENAIKKTDNWSTS